MSDTFFRVGSWSTVSGIWKYEHYNDVKSYEYKDSLGCDQQTIKPIEKLGGDMTFTDVSFTYELNHEHWQK